jgi:hypothetical protein
MRGLALVTLMAQLALTGPAFAGERPVVVELFTSQGCSSCPPADELLSRLAEREDVIALALHVDYWDYIGWKDSFALPQFTARQKKYAAAAGRRTIYTPQMIVDGSDHVVGTHPMDVAELIQLHGQRETGVTVTLLRSDGDLKARVDGTGAGDAVVQFVRFSPSETVVVERGENAGRTLHYANVVREWRVVGQWTGSGAQSFDLPKSDGPVAVIVQGAGFGPILGAAVLK